MRLPRLPPDRKLHLFPDTNMSEATPSPSAPAPAKKRRSRRTLLIILAVAVVVIGAGAAVAINQRAEKPVAVTFDKAVTKTIVEKVNATGKIQPEVEVKIAPEVSGEIIELPLREGATVKKGDLLVRIKPDNYRYQLEQREADLTATRASAIQAKAQLLKAEEDFRRSEELHGKQLLSDSEYTASKTAFEAAQASYDNSQAQIRRVEGLLNQAKDQLEKTVIFAPIEGTVSSRTSEVGERVAGTGQFNSAEVMRVADLNNMEVRVNVNENDIVNVKVGDSAAITIDAYPSRKFRGEVKEIASTARTTGLNTQEEVTNFQVKIRITDKDVVLRPGMSATADIETRMVEKVLAVPIQAVTVRSKAGAKTIEDLAKDRDSKAQQNKGEGAATAVSAKQQREAEKADRDALERVVFQHTGNTVKMIRVQTGIADTTHMEIKSGLKEGDEVVSGPFSVITRTLKDGSKVMLEVKKPEKK